MYGNSISKEECKVWRPLPPEPAEQSGLSTEDYDNCSVEINYDSISLPCERKTPAKPLDLDIKAVTATFQKLDFIFVFDKILDEGTVDNAHSQMCGLWEEQNKSFSFVKGPSIFSPAQWKKYWKRNRIDVLLILTGICLLLSVIFLLSSTSIFLELRSLNLSSTKEVCDASPAPFNFTKLETSVITKLKSLEQQFDEKRKVSLQKMEEQLLRIERKLDIPQNCRAWLKRGMPLKYAYVVKEDCRLLAADSKGRNEYISWRKFQTNVYYFSDAEENWETAKKRCADCNSQLVIINTKHEEDFLIQTLKQSMWLGLSDKEEEGAWRWVDGSPLTKGSWRTGEPNNGGRNGEDCAVLYKEGKWNDIHCEERVKFVCEKEQVSVQ